MLTPDCYKMLHFPVFHFTLPIFTFTPPMASCPFVEIKKLVKRYPRAQVNALDGVDLCIQAGDFFGLLGPNGSGKTSLISILCGLMQKTSGEICYGGEEGHPKLREIKSKIGIVPQQIALYPSMTLVENLKYFGKLYGLGGKLLKERLSYCIELAKLGDVAGQSISTYSGGMQRRANIAVGLVHGPKILFLDEPTVNVDPQSRETIFKSLEALNEEGLTIVYTTHYLEEAQRLCQNLAIIDHGKIVSQGSTRHILESHRECKNLGDVFMHLTGRERRDS